MGPFLRCALTCVLVSASSVAIVGCGGDDSPPSTRINGTVVKGPVAGSTVCVHDMSTGTRVAQLGACTTTDSAGSYSLEVPQTSGLVLVEASGGTYVDEATGMPTNLSAGGPLRTMLALSGQPTTAVASPFTTMAANAAIASGAASVASFDQRLAAVRSAFGLPATLDLVGTAPDFAAASNSYAQALRVVSRLVANGTPLAAVLGATDPTSLAAAFAEAATQLAAPGAVPPGTAAPTTTPTTTPITTPITPNTGTGTTNSTPSASGTLTVTGGRAPAFSPQADGFTVSVSSAGVRYRFFRNNQTTIGSATQTLTTYLEVNTSIEGALLSMVYNDPQRATDASVLCAGASCGGFSVQTPAGATHPVTLNFTNATLGSVTLNGSLTAEVPGAVWRVQDLPRTTDGSVRVNGVDVAVAAAAYTETSAGGSTNFETVLKLVDDATVTLNGSAGGAVSNASYRRGTTTASCFSNCAATVTASSSGVVVALNGLNLSGGLVLGNTIFVGRTAGTVTSPTAGSFSPVKDTVSSTNSRVSYAFEPAAGSPSTGILQLTAVFEGGVVVEASVLAGSAFYSCSQTAVPVLGIGVCSGITLGADRRTINFNSAALTNRQGSISLSGALVAKGL